MKKKVVIVGGGFGGLFTALELGSSVDVTLFVDKDHFLFKPLLYEYLSGEVEAWHIAPRYDELLGSHVQTKLSPITAVDFEERTVASANGATESYDVLVLALGAITNYACVPG